MLVNQKILITLSTLFFLLKGQEIPNEFFLFQSKILLLDSGENWQNTTTFGPFRNNRLENYDPGSDSLKIDLRIGLNGNAADQINGLAFYSYGHLSFQKYYYAYVYSRIVINQKHNKSIHSYAKRFFFKFCVCYFFIFFFIIIHRTQFGF